jgi:hypothetical protein
MSGYTWSITYGDQSSASGTCGKDTLDLGGLKVENQCIELATKLSSSFQRDPGDGLLGLAFSTINTVKRNGRSSPQTTPVDNMISQGDIPAGAELFTSAFYSDRDAGTESFFTFGWVDEALVASSGQEVQWIEIDNSMGFWQFPSTSVQVNGKTVKLSGNTAIADTGTTLALVSDTVCEALYGAIPGATYDSSNGGWVFPLSTKASDLPTFTIACGPYYFQIQPEDFAFAPADSKNWYGGIQSRGDLDFDILGDAFLKSVYAVS